MFEVYDGRDIQTYEIMLADIVFFTVIYVLISLLVQNMVVDNLLRVNKSLNKITDGDLNEKVDVYTSSEFASLSDDINLTVDVLKGYIDAAKKRMEQELLLAHNIQDAALPKNFTFAHNGFELFATMDPAREVGGDFYDFFFVGPDRIALVIADVSDKGVPAALFMMRSKTAIRGLAESGYEPEDIFFRVNNQLCEGNNLNMFVTVWMGIIDLQTGDMKCLNAGHEYPAIMRKGGEYEILKDKHRLPLGAMKDMTYNSYMLHLDPGDCLYVYTDGIPDAINLSEEEYGLERMLKALNMYRDASMEGLLQGVKADQDEFVGSADQFDDITMLGFRYNGPQDS
ncbi:MAG: SpoIIE family protein phosphatase [Mogibacterium sp.]|nr:SpoIIE family protein phosphatase [Mogibacterium sp.]